MNVVDEQGHMRMGVAEDVKDDVHRALLHILQFIRTAQKDVKMRHFAMFILTREGEADDGDQIITSDLISSLEPEDLHEFLRDYLQKETQ